MQRVESGRTPVPEPEEGTGRGTDRRTVLEIDRGTGLFKRMLALVTLGLSGVLATACTPTVQLKAPEEPITINLNIQADVRVKIEEAAEKDIVSNPDIFGE